MTERGTITNSIVIDGYPFRYYRWQDGRYGFNEPTYKALKQYLVAKYSVCYFCSITVKNYDHKEGMRLPPDTATIDHLKPRPNYKNKAGRKKYQVVEKVLACYKCNHDRNEIEQRGAK